MKRYIMLTVSLIAILMVGMTLYALQLGLIDAVSAQEAVEVPFLDAWSASGHADAAAEAFVHWDEDDPAEVPVECAKCHSTPGHQDFLGVDGSAAGTVDAAAPIGTAIECVACHNEATLTKDSVVMPSWVEITGLGRKPAVWNVTRAVNLGLASTKRLPPPPSPMRIRLVRILVF
jgi:hypothetical protein